MSRTVAFLRGINLGNRRLPMARLAALFEELGYRDVETFIASGNVIFSTRVKNRAAVESRIARHLASSLAYEVDTFVRTAEEVAAIARSRVFGEAASDGVTVHVGFLRQPLSADAAQQLQAIRTADDEFRVVGQEYYWLCRIRTSDSQVWRTPAMRALRLPSSTMRNMTSIRKLVAKHIGRLDGV